MQTTTRINRNLAGIVIGCLCISAASTWFIHAIHLGNTQTAYFSCIIISIAIIVLGFLDLIPLLRKTLYLLILLTCTGGLTMAFFLKNIFYQEQKIKDKIVGIKSIADVESYRNTNYFQIKEPFSYLDYQFSGLTQIGRGEHTHDCLLIPMVANNASVSDSINLFFVLKLNTKGNITFYSKVQAEYLADLETNEMVAQVIKNPTETAVYQTVTSKMVTEKHMNIAHYPVFVEIGKLEHKVGYQKAISIGFATLNGIWIITALFFIRKDKAV
ncbi:MAG: hypothetical protein H7Y04_00110 [Verrucomicrobia bacterium]|nr:hypothetical protein [Cytophagales bacterium]